MTGRQLFEKLTIRDYSQSEADEYAQMLQTIFFNIGTEVFELLEISQKQGKKLDIVPFDSNYIKDEISKSDIIFV